MSLRMIIASTVVAFGVALASAAAAEGKQDFTLVNKTGYTLSELYVAPSKSDDWEEDVLGQDVLADGEATDVVFERSAKSCKWDLRVVYEEDDSDAIWYGIDLCTVSQVTIKYNRSTNTTSASFN